MSLLSPSVTPISSTKRLSRDTHLYTKPTITTAAAAAAAASGARRVYGKRKANAPRAVLEREINNTTSSEAPARKEEDGGAEIDNMISAVERDLSALQLDVRGERHGANRDTEDVKITFQLGALGGLETQKDEQALVEVRVSPYGDAQRVSIAHREETPSSKSPVKVKPRRKPRRSSGWIEDLKLNNYVRPILKEATSPISSRGIQRFTSWARRAGDMFTVEKIAEGSYGEVYQLRLSGDISRCNLSKSRLARLKAYKDGVFKIIPLRAQRGVGSKKFTTVQEIVSEVQLLKLLDPIPGFARFREVHVVQGRFPDAYQQAWTRYSQTNGNDCLNPDPSKVKSYPETQLWVVLEMDNAGYELEKFPWSSTFQVYDIFWGVALALARAEQFAGFEHRDLHLGNICIKPTKKSGNTLRELLKSRSGGLDGGPTGFGLSGLETTIIDYSLSRAELQPTDASGDEDTVVKAESDSQALEIAWSDLDKKQIFGAIGRDEDEKLLRDTYRYMRSEVYHQDNLLSPTQPPAKPRQWKEYNPRTNLIWLSFLLQMLMKKHKPTCAYEQAMPEQRQRQPLTPRPANHKLDNINVHHVYNGDTACDRNSPSNSWKRDAFVKRDGGNDGKKLDIAQQQLAQQWQQLQEELTLRLRTTADMLSVESGIEDLYCAGDLVAFAIGSGWLGEGDFLC